VLGALFGDTVGSVYEWNNVKAEGFQPPVAPRAFFTDDTVLIASAA